MKGATFAAQDSFLAAVISIHAPMKGATMLAPCVGRLYGYFNPRTHEGCDVAIRPKSVALQLFQSTHP